MSQKKRSRTEQESSRAPIVKFVSARAEERYNESVKKKQKLIPERGFVGDDLPPFILQNIQERGWSKFCAPPNEPGVVTIVREFYANYPEKSQDDKILVRGQEVVCNVQAINAYFGLPTLPRGEDAFLEFLKTKPSNDSLVSELCAPNTVWEGKRSAKTYIKTKCLLKEAKIWYHFLVSRLMPTSHTSDITADRLILLYGLVKGIKFDIGSVLMNEIHNSATTDKYALFFPSLITSLCKHAGVKWSKKDELCPIGPSIDLRAINTMKGWDELQDLPPPSTDPGQSSQPPSTSSSSPSLQPVLSKLDLLTDTMIQGFADVHARQDGHLMCY